MKNLFYSSLLFLTLFSCKELGKDEVSLPEAKKLDLIIEKVEESDKDKYGCLASAGYSWSKLNKDCVKIIDVAIHLVPKNNPTNEDETKNAYLVFSEGNEAEIYLPNDIESKIFVRKNQGEPWVYQEWTLIASNGFVLKKDDIILFSGDGERGAKITGSDKNDD